LIRSQPSSARTSEVDLRHGHLREHLVEDRIRRDRREAPADVQWSFNPTQEVDDILSRVQARAHGAGLQVTTVASPGDPADVLIQHAAEQEADVLVVGNKGLERRILGSVPNSVTHRAPCTVIVVKTS